MQVRYSTRTSSLGQSFRESQSLIWALDIQLQCGLCLSSHAQGEASRTPSLLFDDPVLPHPHEGNRSARANVNPRCTIIAAFVIDSLTSVNPFIDLFPEYKK